MTTRTVDTSAKLTAELKASSAGDAIEVAANGPITCDVTGVKPSGEVIVVPANGYTPRLEAPRGANGAVLRRGLIDCANISLEIGVGHLTIARGENVNVYGKLDGQLQLRGDLAGCDLDVDLDGQKGRGVFIDGRWNNQALWVTGVTGRIKARDMGDDPLYVLGGEFDLDVDIDGVGLLWGPAGSEQHGDGAQIASARKSRLRGRIRRCHNWGVIVHPPDVASQAGYPVTDDLELAVMVSEVGSGYVGGIPPPGGVGIGLVSAGKVHLRDTIVTQCQHAALCLFRQPSREPVGYDPANFVVTYERSMFESISRVDPNRGASSIDGPIPIDVTPAPEPPLPPPPPLPPLPVVETVIEGMKTVLVDGKVISSDPIRLVL